MGVVQTKRVQLVRQRSTAAFKKRIHCLAPQRRRPCALPEQSLQFLVVGDGERELLTESVLVDSGKPLE